LDDQRRDGGTNSTLRTKEQGTHLTLNEHDDDDDDDDDDDLFTSYSWDTVALIFEFIWHTTCYFVHLCHRCYDI